MAKKYMNELGVEEGICSFNTHLSDDSKRDIRFAMQREENDFDERETWALYYTAAEWLYCHLKMYLELGGEVVNLEFHKFNIDVLIWSSETEMYDTERFEVTQKAAIETAIHYLEDFLTYDLKDDYDWLEEYRAFEKMKAAFHIFAEISPAMWW